MSFGQTGYDNIPKGGSGADPNKIMQFFFGTDEQGPQHKRRVMLLDGARAMPFGFHLHNHFIKRTGTRIEEVCLLKNGLGKSCPLCEHEALNQGGEMKRWFPQYVGCFTTFVLGRVDRRDGKLVIAPIERTYKGKTYQSQWDRRHLILNRGSDAKPGALRGLVDLAADKFGVVPPELPNMQGVVFDAYRSVGTQTNRVGDKWEIVSYKDAPLRVEPDKWLDYLRAYGLDAEAEERLAKFGLLTPIDHSAYWEARVKTPDQLAEVLRSALGERGADRGGDYEAEGGFRGGSGDEPPEGFGNYGGAPDDEIPF